MASPIVERPKHRLLQAAVDGKLKLLKLGEELDFGEGLAKTFVQVKDAGGRTALHLAAAEGKTHVCKYLVQDLGLDENLKDRIAGHGHHAAVIVLLPVTSRIPTIPDWSLVGIMKHVRSDEGRKQAIDVAPDATVFSNRSLCCARLNEGSRALSDIAEGCVALRPDWGKAHYREGVAWKLLGNLPMSTEAFSEGLKVDPENEELKVAFREAVEAEFGMLVSEGIRIMCL